MTGSAGTDIFVPSRYVSLSHQDDGSMIVHCARTGAVGRVAPENVVAVRDALRPGARTPGPLTDVLHTLQRGGFLVESGIDERQAVVDNYIARYTAPKLHLILMPTEQCNFRCTYCYESFARGAMSRETVAGIKRFVAGQGRLDSLTVSWFGGEPLLEPGIVCEVTEYLSGYCRGTGTRFRCAATTNGSLLVPGMAERFLRAGLTQFQVSLDGPRHEHDRRRVGADGAGTYDAVLANLVHLHGLPDDFEVAVRFNFDADNVPLVEEFYAELEDHLGGDPRFVTELQPIGRWGGANDADLNVCEGHETYRALSSAKTTALRHGFRETQTAKTLEPNGSVCYAADPRSFVVGADGKVYKCTVELDTHDRNIVGQLHGDGTMDIDWRKMALWCETNGSNEAVTKCTNCYFSPSCHGAACPKEWMDERECACPKTKHTIGDSLTYVALDSLYARTRKTATSGAAPRRTRA